MPSFLTVYDRPRLSHGIGGFRFKHRSVTSCSDFQVIRLIFNKPVYSNDSSFIDLKIFNLINHNQANLILFLVLVISLISNVLVILFLRGKCNSMPFLVRSRTYYVLSKVLVTAS